MSDIYKSSELYTSLQVSPRKKRGFQAALDDVITLTPKKLRTVPPTPPRSVTRSGTKAQTELPGHLTRLFNIQIAVQQALSHALATCAVAPTSDSGIVKNVLNHLSLKTYTGLTAFEIDDLKRLCWVWGWDGTSLECLKQKPTPVEEEEDNPFLDRVPISGVEWTRGSMGFVLSPATHYSKSDRKRVPAYGIGIEVEMDIDKDMGGGMAAVARWTAASTKRRIEFRRKLEQWATLHADDLSVPPVPLVELPVLAVTPKVSSLTHALASCSPKASTSPQKFPAPPSSPSRSPMKKSVRDFAVPFPLVASGTSPTKKTTLFPPQTPRRNRSNPSSSLLTPQTPVALLLTPSEGSMPSTPVHQRGSSAGTAPQTPSTSRRQALYERVRQRSLTASPTKSLGNEVTRGTLTRDQMLKMNQEEMRRRCLLGRLGGVADSVWMLFSNPVTGASGTPSGRKRRALPATEVALAIIKSSPVPISTAEANESLAILTDLCPFFLKKLTVAGAEWLEMPSSINTTTAGSASNEESPTKRGPAVSASPKPVKGKEESAHALVTRSPRSVRREAGGLREVREIIRRELELQN